MKRSSTKLVGFLTLLAYMATSAHGLAHNNRTHQLLVNEAWQVMRAGNRTDLLNHISWPGGSVPSSAPQLDQPGDCSLPASDPKNLCGRTVSQQEWTDYLTEVQRAREELAGLSTELPIAAAGVVGCESYSPNTSLADFSRPVSPNHMGDSEAYEDSRRSSCSFDGTPRVGIYSEFEVPGDGSGYEGMVLGWHAQHRDQDQADTWVEWSIGPQIIDFVTTIYELVLGAIIFPVVCVWAFFAGENCFDATERISDDLDPIDYLKGIIPGVRDDDASSQGKSLWHFINVQDGCANEYDDHQGMFYEEAGPNRTPSGVDQAIMLGADLAFMALDASDSAGTERYEITDDETSFDDPSSDRGEVRWQMESIGHIAFSPLDNFAYYGDQGLPNGHPGSPERGNPRQMGWPLHAIGDASVPYHVVGTTGWGHRPFEDVCDEDWGIYMFEQCRPGDPCDSNLSQPDVDYLKLNQLQQAHRILQRGFRWNEFLKAHNDPRDFITQLAKETLAVSMETPEGFGTPSFWCDSCSSGYAAQHNSDMEAWFIENYTEDWDQQAVEDPEGFFRGTIDAFAGSSAGRDYFDDVLFQPTRLLMEQAVGATLGYLSFRGGRDNNCSPNGEACGPASGCCDGRCDSGSCCRSGGERCYQSSECCSGSCVNEVCESPLRDTCRASSCSQGQCVAGVCCLPGTQACSGNLDCCSGKCVQGNCAPGDCATVGCPFVTQTCDSNSRCCTNSGSTCASHAQCCSGTCGVNGKCAFLPKDSCSGDAECSTGLCASGKCCIGNGDSCGGHLECCSSECTNGVCVGRKDGLGCNDFSQCASGRCVNNVCESIVK